MKLPQGVVPQPRFNIGDVVLNRIGMKLTVTRRGYDNMRYRDAWYYNLQMEDGSDYPNQLYCVDLTPFHQR